MKLGIDVSEHNGFNNWSEIAKAGVKFAIIRAGFGEDSLDERFYENVNGALAAGIEIGVYWFCYATCVESLKKEMDFLLALLKDCGLTPDKVPMGVFLDVEDDSYVPRLLRRRISCRLQGGHLLQRQLVRQGQLHPWLRIPEAHGVGGRVESHLHCGRG